MRIDLDALAREWPLILGAAAAVLVVKAADHRRSVRARAYALGAAVETGVHDGEPVGNQPDRALGGGRRPACCPRRQRGFWTTVTAIGLTVTPLLAAAGKRMGAAGRATTAHSAARGCRRGPDGDLRLRPRRPHRRRHAERTRPPLSRDRQRRRCRSRKAAEGGYDVLFGDVSRPELAERLQLGHAAALVLTMDDPVQVARIARRVRGWVPDLPIIARARDTAQAARLYKAGVTDAVPETLEASLQLSEAVLVDIGVAMGPVIASHPRKARPVAREDQGRSGDGRRAAPPGQAAAARRSGVGRRLEAEHAGAIGACDRDCRRGADCRRIRRPPENRTGRRPRGRRR